MYVQIEYFNADGERVESAGCGFSDDMVTEFVKEYMRQPFDRRINLAISHCEIHPSVKG